MQKTASHAPPAHLLHDVMDGVFAARRRQVLARRLPFLIAGLAISFSGAVYATMLAIQQAVDAGLPQFLAAAATDTEAVVAVWQSYLLALADALPLMPIAGICGTLCIFAALLRRTDRLVATPGSHRLTHV